MSKLTKTLTVKKGSTTQNIPFYTTIDEANQYGDYGTAIVDGVTAYYPLGATDSADTGSSHKTNMGCKKDGKNLYFLTKGNGELPLYNLELAATSNQTITLKYKNRNYKDTGYESELTETSTGSNQTFSVRKGTTWTATIAAASGYDAGTLSASSGTVNANTTVSASDASEITVQGKCKITLKGTSNQEVRLEYKEPNGQTVKKTSTVSDQIFLVDPGTTYTVGIYIIDEDYCLGDVTVLPDNKTTTSFMSGTIDEDKIILTSEARKWQNTILVSEDFSFMPNIDKFYCKLLNPSKYDSITNESYGGSYSTGKQLFQGIDTTKEVNIKFEYTCKKVREQYSKSRSSIVYYWKNGGRQVNYSLCNQSISYSDRNSVPSSLTVKVWY